MPPEQPSRGSGGIAVSGVPGSRRRPSPTSLIAPAVIVIVAILGYPSTSSSGSRSSSTASSS